MKNYFKTISDMGNIKIFNSDISLFFSNGYGDGENKVYINKTPRTEINLDKFLGHFTVKTEAYLSDYDCDDTPIYTFEKGRWFVYLLKEGVFRIIKEDNELKS